MKRIKFANIADPINLDVSFCCMTISITGVYYSINTPCFHCGDLQSWLSVKLIDFLARNDPITASRPRHCHTQRHHRALLKQNWYNGIGMVLINEIGVKGHRCYHLPGNNSGLRFLMEWCDTIHIHLPLASCLFELHGATFLLFNAIVCFYFWHTQGHKSYMDLN